MSTVTLAMPVYNVEAYIENALLSALNQTFDDIEYLIIDDKGQDKSMDIVREIIAKHPRGEKVRIIEHPHNIGTGATKNSAIKNTTSPYLYFMDSDDEIIPETIELLHKEMAQKNVDVVIGSYQEIKGETRSQNHVLNDELMKDPITIMKSYFQHNKYPVFTWNKLYNVNFLRCNNIECIPNQRGEDVYFTAQVMSKISSICVSSFITYKYMRQPSSLSVGITNNGLSKKMFEESMETISSILKLKNGTENLIARSLIHQYCFNSLCQLLTVLMKKNNMMSKEEKQLSMGKINKIVREMKKEERYIPTTKKKYLYQRLLKAPIFEQKLICKMIIQYNKIIEK